MSSKKPPQTRSWTLKNSLEAKKVADEKLERVDSRSDGASPTPARKRARKVSVSLTLKKSLVEELEPVDSQSDDTSPTPTRKRARKVLVGPRAGGSMPKPAANSGLKPAGGRTIVIPRAPTALQKPSGSFKIPSSRRTLRSSSSHNADAADDAVPTPNTNKDTGKQHDDVVSTRLKDLAARPSMVKKELAMGRIRKKQHSKEEDEDSETAVGFAAPAAACSSTSAAARPLASHGRFPSSTFAPAHFGRPKAASDKHVLVKAADLKEMHRKASTIVERSKRLGTVPESLMRVIQELAQSLSEAQEIGKGALPVAVDDEEEGDSDLDAKQMQKGKGKQHK
uniref:Ribosome biogenesis protein SLX9 n=1 Tax=Mycena chlorophos TaxID=658473 RepID=A0ABQ0LBC7_MYCCL|nr:predicted protein [Mycena chlorophos]